MQCGVVSRAFGIVYIAIANGVTLATRHVILQCRGSWHRPVSFCRLFTNILVTVLAKDDPDFDALSAILSLLVLNYRHSVYLDKVDNFYKNVLAK